MRFVAILLVAAPSLALAQYQQPTQVTTQVIVQPAQETVADRYKVLLKNQEIQQQKKNDADNFALRVLQEEEKLKTEIVTRRQTSLAIEEVSKLDPEKDPDWRRKYLEILADFPYARNDKFLNDTFKQMCEAETKQKADARKQTQQSPLRADEIDWAGIASASAKAKQSALPPIDTKNVVDESVAAGEKAQPGK